MVCCPSACILRLTSRHRTHEPGTCADKPNAEVVREKVQDGLTGEQREIQYTQCKIVGNGSFGVVFQTKLSPSGEDAAIKRVLQDKRFKVQARTHTTTNTVADVVAEP